MSEVLIERVSRTSVISINRPEARNSLTRAVITGVTAAFVAASTDKEIRCVVLTGTGGHFCAGADLRKNLMDDPDLMDHLDQYMDEYHALIKAIVRCTKPTVAMMEGAAVGFGADVALACDLRVAATTAYVQEKFVKIGLMPDGGGTFFLPRLVGLARAMRMILLAEKVEGAEMQQLGLLAGLCEPTLLRETTLKLAVELEKGPPLSFEYIKAAIQASLGSLDEALAREREGQLKLLRSSDCMEGIMSWAQKRDPNFEGK